MSFTYRGLREFNPLDIGNNWESVEERYWNPHSQWYECLYNGRHITIKPDLVGYQDGRIHVIYKDGTDEAWLDCLPEDPAEKPGTNYLNWRLIDRSGTIRNEMNVVGWCGCSEHCDLRWLWGYFSSLPNAILVLVVAAVIKSAGYKGKGMFLHEINPAVIREDWMYHPAVNREYWWMHPCISLPAGMSDEEKEKIHDCFNTYRKED